MQRKWTKEEEEYLKKWYCKKPTEEIMKHLNRTRNSIRRKADNMGITDASNKIRGQEWKPIELQYLELYYGVKTISEIAKALRRSSSSVQNKATRLGLADPDKKQDSKPWTEWEETYLEKKYLRYSSEHIADRLGRTIYSVRRKAQSMGLNVYQGEEIHLKTLSYCFNSDSRVVKRWIDKFDLPHKKMQRGEMDYITIEVKLFWKWAFNHQDIIPWSKYEYLSLLPQPEWVDEAVRNYRAEFKNHRKPITHFDKSTVARMLRQGYNYNEIALELGRTVESVKHIEKSLKEV